ncbi:phosphodiester glycosidase family protein [Rickettsia endosymbiont of Halotydeus destructor]|uniref:phosphodiester glycosidase family protein n=1 Tax=Rickettsia endosymbiont of Halotydeus destructor TaxID=2996754 RepID=UPI003BAEE5FB
MNKLAYLFLISILFSSNMYAAKDEGLTYNRYKKDKHVIHQLTIDPKHFHLKLVKAHNQVIGRETVEAMALRSNAVAAINAGFFEIAGSDDGRPSLTLMINGKLFGLRKQLQSLLIIDQSNIQIIEANAKISVEIDDKSIIPNQVNYFASSKDITFYNDVWAPTTLTPYTNKEILIDQNFVIIEISNHGDNQIPQKGFVLSFGADRAMPLVKAGDKVKLNLELIDKENKPVNLSKNASIVTGIPLLVQNGKNVINNPKKNDPAHAHTALGIRNDGTIIIVVAEHIYKQHIKDLRLEQVRLILKKVKSST